MRCDDNWEQLHQIIVDSFQKESKTQDVQKRKKYIYTVYVYNSF